MSEVLHHDDMDGDFSPPIPIDRKQRAAEVIDFSKASAELVTGLFMTELRHPSRASLSGQSLATFIESEMNAGSDEDPQTLRSRLSRIVDAADAFGNDELYEHKLASDEVFQALIDKLQTTKKDPHLRDQRKATLKLAELRATLHDDVTDDDSTWHDVIGRLYR